MGGDLWSILELKKEEDIHEGNVRGMMITIKMPMAHRRSSMRPALAKNVPARLMGRDPSPVTRDNAMYGRTAICRR